VARAARALAPRDCAEQNGEHNRGCERDAVAGDGGDAGGQREDTGAHDVLGQVDYAGQHRRALGFRRLGRQHRLAQRRRPEAEGAARSLGAPERGLADRDEADRTAQRRREREGHRLRQQPAPQQRAHRHRGAIQSAPTSARPPAPSTLDASS
jgi:hypothetical protein